MGQKKSNHTIQPTMEKNEQSMLSCNNSSDMNHIELDQIQNSLLKVEQFKEDKVEDHSKSGQIHQSESSNTQQKSKSEMKKLHDSKSDLKQVQNSKIQQSQQSQQSLQIQDQSVLQQLKIKSQKFQKSGQVLSNQAKNEKSSQLKISDSKSKEQKSDSFCQQSQFQGAKNQLNVGISDNQEKLPWFHVSQISIDQFTDEQLQILSWISIISPNIKKYNKISKYCEDFINRLKENQPKLLQFLNHVFKNNAVEIVRCFKKISKSFKKTFILNNDADAILGHLKLSGRVFQMDQFLQPKWQYLALIDMRCCEIDDKMWSQLSNNIDNFPNLIQLDLTLNRIVTVVQSDLTKFNHLKRFKLVSVADNPLSIESRKVLGRWRPTLKIQKQAAVEFSWLDIKHKQFKFSNLAKKQPLLMNLIQRISFAKKGFDYNQWQAVVFYMKQFPLMIELDLSGNQIVQITFQDLEKINYTIQKRFQVLNQKLTLDLMGNKLSQESYKQIQGFYEVYPYSSLILKSISTPELFHSERLRLLPVKNIYRVLLEMYFKNHELKQQITEELFETITEQFLIQLNNNWQFQKARTKYLELWGYVESQFLEVHKPKIKEKHLNNFKELLNSLQIPFNKAKLIHEGLFY